MNKSESVKILSSTKCHCGKSKSRRMAFCKNCYFQLSPVLRRNLYASIGNGFEEAYLDALACLESGEIEQAQEL